uniref:Mediator of RNA polymerase II transcription subunit 24 n=1 Tax=Strongyloides venezuelensis TaxID=75913 RepID=A0A0K0F5K4_STRVS
MPEQQDIVFKIFNIVKCAALGTIKNSEFASIIKSAIDNKTLTRKEMHQICGLVITAFFDEDNYGLKYLNPLESLINLCVISGDIVIGAILKTKFEKLDKKKIGNFFVLFKFVDFLVSKKKPTSSKGNDVMKVAEEILSIFNWYVELSTWDESETFTNYVAKRLFALLQNRYNCILLHATSKKSSECKKLLESRAVVLETKYPEISSYIRENVLIFKSTLERPYSSGLHHDFESISSMMTVYATLRTLESARDIAEAVYMASKNLQFTKIKMLYDMFKGVLYNFANNKTRREGRLFLGFAIIKFPKIIKSLVCDLRVLDEIDIVATLAKIATESKLLCIVDFQCKYSFWELFISGLEREGVISESNTEQALYFRSLDYKENKETYENGLFLKPNINFPLNECINAWEHLIKLPLDNLPTVLKGLKHVIGIEKGEDNFTGILMTMWFKEELGNLSRLFSKINYLCQCKNDSLDEDSKAIRLELFDTTLILLFTIYFHFPDFTIEEFIGLPKKGEESENEESFLFYIWNTKIDKKINIPNDPEERTFEFDWDAPPIALIENPSDDVENELDQIINAITDGENNKNVKKSTEEDEKKVVHENYEKMDDTENLDLIGNDIKRDDVNEGGETKDDKENEGGEVKMERLKCPLKLENDEEIDSQTRLIVDNLYKDKPFWDDEIDFAQAIKFIPKIAFTLCEDLRMKLHDKSNILDAFWCFRSMPSLVICLFQCLETGNNTHARNEVLDAIQIVLKKGKFDDDTVYNKWHFVYKIIGKKINDLVKIKAFQQPGTHFLISGFRKTLPVLEYKEIPHPHIIADAMIYTIKHNFVLPEALRIFDHYISVKGITSWCDSCFQELLRLETPDELDLASSLLLSIAFCRPTECFNEITKHIVDSILNADTWYMATHQPGRSALARLLVRSMCCMIWVSENRKHKEIYEKQLSFNEEDPNMNTLEIVFSRFYKETLSGHLKPTISFIIEFIYELAIAPQTPELSRLYSFVSRKFIFNLARLDPYSVTIDLYYRIFNFDDNGDNGLLQFATLHRFKGIL